MGKRSAEEGGEAKGRETRKKVRFQEATEPAEAGPSASTSSTSRAERFDEDAEVKDYEREVTTLQRTLPSDAITEVEGEEEADVEYDQGMRIEPFNLRKEMEEGYFDASGNYVEHRFRSVVRDAWMDDWEERWERGDLGNEKKGDREGIHWSLRSKKAEKPSSKDDEEEGEGEEEGADEKTLLERMLTFLQPGEHTLQALRRLRKEKEAFNKLTETADSLLATGRTDIYQEKQETLQKYLDQSKEGGKEGVMWEYKWDASSLLQYGPFSGSQMAQWAEEGYFQHANTADMLVRRVGESDWRPFQGVSWTV